MEALAERLGARSATDLAGRARGAGGPSLGAAHARRGPPGAEGAPEGSTAGWPLSGGRPAAAQEASRLAGGAGFRAWWAALLRQGRQPRDLPGGVALLTRRWRAGAAPQGLPDRRRRGRLRRRRARGLLRAGGRSPEPADSNARLGLPCASRAATRGRRRSCWPAPHPGGDGAEADQAGPLVPDPGWRARRPPLPRCPPAAAGAARRHAYQPSWAPWSWASRPSRRCAASTLLAALLGGAAPGGGPATRRGGGSCWGRCAAPRGSRPRPAEWPAPSPRRRLVGGARERLRRDLRGAPAAGRAEGVRAARRRRQRGNARHAGALRGARFGGDAAEAERAVKDRWSELWAAGHLLSATEGGCGASTCGSGPCWPTDRRLPARHHLPLAADRTRQRRAGRLRTLRPGEVAPRPGFVCRTARCSTCAVRGGRVRVRVASAGTGKTTSLVRAT